MRFSVLLLAAFASGAPNSEFQKAENVIKNGCVCGRTLYADEFEARRLSALNKCVEELFSPELKFKGADPVPADCPQAAIVALKNLREFADWKIASFDAAQREELDACFYGRLGFRLPDGSANVSAILDEITRAQKAERDRGLTNLKKANREADPSKKSEFMAKFNDATHGYKFLTYLTTRAKEVSICDRSQVSKHYRCTFEDCFAKSLGVPDF
jgi:hypothetical protein